MVPKNDLNMKGKYSSTNPQNSKYYHDLPTLHMLVLANEEQMVKTYLAAGPGFDFKQLDPQGRNACDLALEMGYQNILHLL